MKTLHYHNECTSTLSWVPLCVDRDALLISRLNLKLDLEQQIGIYQVAKKS